MHIATITGIAFLYSQVTTIKQVGTILYAHMRLNINIDYIYDAQNICMLCRVRLKRNKNKEIKIT